MSSEVLLLLIVVGGPILGLVAYSLIRKFINK